MINVLHLNLFDIGFFNRQESSVFGLLGTLMIKPLTYLQEQFNPPRAN